MASSTSEQRQRDQADALKELQAAQKAALAGDGKTLPMTTANRAKGRKIKAHEAHLIHVDTLTKSAAPDGKSLIEEKKSLKFHARTFNDMVKAGAFHAFDDVIVIHDPRPDAPTSYNFKPEVISDNPLTRLPKSDAAQASALAAREQKLKDQEAAVDRKLAELDEKLAAINAANQGTGKAELPELPADLGTSDASEKKGKEDKTKKA